MPARDTWRVQTKPCAHWNPWKEAVIPTRDSVRLACDYLRVSYGGMSQQQPAAGTGALAAEVLGGATCCISPLGRGCHYSNYRATGWVIHKLENNYTKKLLALL